MTTPSFFARSRRSVSKGSSHRRWCSSTCVGVWLGATACSAGASGGARSSVWDGGGAALDAGRLSAGDAAGNASAPTPAIDASSAPSSGLGAPTFAPGDLDPPSNGGTITFEAIGAAGWYPSIRDPAVGPCDAFQSSTCCLAKDSITSDALTPWDEELIMTLRGPMQVKQLAVYQPGSSGDAWNLVSAWDDRGPTVAGGAAFSGDATPKAEFDGGVGSECNVNVATDRSFGCGPGSSPYCAPGAATDTWGWAGSKLFVLLAKMGHAGTADAPAACSTTDTGNWYDAPWIGLAVGELARAGSFASCQCFAKDPTNWALADGCGQFNVFEVVNDNDSSKNLDVFSTDLIDYSGYVGQGPCGAACDAGALGPAVDSDRQDDRHGGEGRRHGDAVRRTERRVPSPRERVSLFRDSARCGVADGAARARAPEPDPECSGPGVTEPAGVVSGLRGGRDPRPAIADVSRRERMGADRTV